MGLEDNISKLSDQRNEAIEKFTEELYKIIGKGEESFYKELIRKYLIKELELTPTGEIKNLTSNYASTINLDKIFNKAVLNDTSGKLVDAIIDGTLQLNKINSKYFELLSKPTVKKIANVMLDKILASFGIEGKKLTKESPLNKAVTSQEPLNKVKGLIHQAIATQAKITDLEASLKQAIVDEGLLKKYLDSKGVTNIYDRYDRQTTQEYSQALQLDYAIYQGGLIRDSRDFCKERNAKVFTREEISRFGTPADKFGGYTNKSKGEFAGKFLPSTKVYEPFSDLGGYNCRHHLDWISDDLALALRPELKGNKEARHLAKKAKAVGDDVQQMAEDVAEKYGAKVTPINYKTVESIERKVRDEYNGDITKLTDSVRNTIVAERSKLKEISEELAKNPLTTRVKLQDFDSGYKGYLINVKTPNGTLGEIQLNTPRMIFAKEKEVDARRILGDSVYDDIAKEIGLEGGLGHKYYEEIRELVAKAGEPDLQAKLDRIMELSRMYYKNFYQ